MTKRIAIGGFLHESHSFAPRPTRYVDITAGYKQYDYDNRTPEFEMTQRVAYDNTVSAVTPAVESEPFGVLRHTLDADLKLSPRSGVSAGIGVTRLQEERTHRIFESTTDNVVRITADALNHRWFALRSKFEHAQRRGTGIEEGEAELASIGEQRGIRHFDIANRDRNRVTILGSLTPMSNLGITASIAAGKDDYLESLFGLRDNTHRIYALGFDATPSDRVILTASYSFERYNALSRSRQAKRARRSPPRAQTSAPTGSAWRPRPRERHRWPSRTSGRAPAASRPRSTTRSPPRPAPTSSR